MTQKIKLKGNTYFLEEIYIQLSREGKIKIDKRAYEYNENFQESAEQIRRELESKEAAGEYLKIVLLSLPKDSFKYLTEQLNFDNYAERT